MTQYIMLASFFALILMSSTAQKRDTMPEGRLDVAAKTLTDRQLESISRSDVSNTFVIHFRDLRRHIDSLNANNIMQRMALDSASRSRDSLTYAMVRIISENLSLKASNEQYRQDMVFAIRTPHYIFFFALVVAATFFGNGLYRGWEKYKLNKDQNL